MSLYLKYDVDKLEIDKLETVSIGLRKLSVVVENDVVKSAGYNELIKKNLMLFMLLMPVNKLKKIDCNTKN